MSEYERHLEAYATHSHQYFTALVARSDWGDKDLAERYLEKYWLPLAEYESKWKQIQHRIFLGEKCLPELVFSTPYELLAFRGGGLNPA